MLPCLTKSEIDIYADEIKEEFEYLLSHPQLAVRSHSKQWDFFRHCFNVLMDDARGDFDCDKNSAVDYWHEVSRKLRKYYSKAHKKSIRFKFKLIDKKQKGKLFHQSTDFDYACANEYILLIIPTDPSLNTVQQISGILYRAIDDAIHAEFNVYNRLPRENFKPLKKYFDLDGPAYRKIVDSVKEHHRNNEIISNKNNPSTRPQLISFVLKELNAKLAKVSVEEYWNLHWLSSTQQVYVKIYHGQNRQHYTLIKRRGHWIVLENEFRPPRGLTYNAEADSLRVRT